MLIVTLTGSIESETPLKAAVNATQVHDYQARGIECSLEENGHRQGDIFPEGIQPSTTTDVDFYDLTDPVGGEVARGVISRAVRDADITYGETGVPLSPDNAATFAE